VLETRKKHGSVPKIHTRSGLDATMNRHRHSRCHYKRNSSSVNVGTNNPPPPHWRARGAIRLQVVHRCPLQQQRQRPPLRVAELQQQWPQGGRCCNNALAHVYARGARTSTKSRRPGTRMVAVIPPATRTSPAAATCHTRILGVQNPGANIITRCAGTKSHTYDESWHMIECHIFIYNRSSIQNK
jgi:hypothetical protein